MPPGTRRQELVALLRGAEVGFDELRRDLLLPVKLLEDDLRHIERSLRAGPERLVVTPARCRGCGFEFRSRAARHLHTPGRCPRCRSEQVDSARLRVAPR